MIIIASLNVQARFFLEPLEKFINDGKEYTLILEEGLERITISPEKDMILYGETEERLELKKGFDYIIRLATDRTVYELQILATTNRDRAVNLQEELFQKGYRDVIILEENGWFKVRLSGYTEKKLLDRARESLEEEGFDIWLISRKIEMPAELIITDPMGEVLLSGEEFSINGEVIINGEKYPGLSRFVLAGKGFSILNNVELSVLLSALMLQMEREDYYFTNNHQEYLKARAVSLRTALLYLVVERSIFKQGYYFSLPEYHGTAEVSENIRKAISDTEGLVLGRNELIAELDLRDLLTGGFAVDVIEKGILQNLSFDRILEEQYPGMFLKDLTKDLKEERLVDARVKTGLYYREYRQLTWWGPRNITVLDLDLNRENLIAEPVLAGKGVSGLNDLAEMVRNREALAGVNGGYFGSNARPLGFLMKDGMVISEPLMERTSLIFTEEGEVLISPVKWQACLQNRRAVKNLLISGVNRKPGTDEAVIINRYYGERAPELKEGILELVINKKQIIAINEGSAGESTQIPAEGYIIQIHGKGREIVLDYQPGDEVEYQDIFEAELKDLKPHKALGAGPRLIENGEIKITAAEEKFQPDISYGRAPRTAVGLTAEGHLLMVTIDGRQPELSIGMTLNELAEWMLNYGIIEGMNLDGGYSARMVVRGFTMNNPGQERLVNNGILIFSR